MGWDKFIVIAWDATPSGYSFELTVSSTTSGQNRDTSSGNSGTKTNGMLHSRRCRNFVTEYPDLKNLIATESRMMPRLSRLNEAAADAVKQLLPDYADNDLASLCSWADRVKFRYHWSSPLHYIDTPDDLCNYEYSRDCKDENGEEGFCVSGAIQNYTKQLLTYGTSSESQYIHQPLHVGFTSDKGGNTIDVHWYRRKTVLHHVWDDNIIETAEEQFYSSSVEDMIDDIKKNITGEWAGLVGKWERCSSGRNTCPDIYATESIAAACDWAYKNVTEDSTLDDNYFLSRYPIANLRLAESGVRLAATLNRIWG
ncbi:Endonuclease 2 [Asimina triloba]